MRKLHSTEVAGQAYYPRMLRPALALASLLSLAACGTFAPPASRPEARDIQDGDRLSVQAACRDAANRTLTRQDRGQLMREDERGARLGSESTTLSMRTQIDQMGRQFRRDSLARDCERQNSASAPDQAAAAPATR